INPRYHNHISMPVASLALPIQKVNNTSNNPPMINKIQFIFSIYDNTFLIIVKASTSCSSLDAYDNRIQFGLPKASPVTVATLAFSNKYIEKSAALFILTPFNSFPK